MAASACLLGCIAIVSVELLAVDRCLDGGGSFDYTAGRCDFERSHPSRPVSRSSLRLLGGGLALALAFVAARRLQGRLDRGERA
jgi:hypothetical protein